MFSSDHGNRSLKEFEKLKCYDPILGMNEKMLNQMMVHILDSLGAIMHYTSLCRSTSARFLFDPVLEKIFWASINKISNINLNDINLELDKKSFHSEVKVLMENNFPNDRKSIDGSDWLPLQWAVMTYDKVNFKECQQVTKQIPFSKIRNQTLEKKAQDLVEVKKNPDIPHTNIIFKPFPNYANTLNNNGELPLHLAVKNSYNIKLIDFLLERNPSYLGALDKKSNTLLQNALYNKEVEDEHIQLITHLLQLDHKNKYIFNKNRDGDTCLHVAASAGCGVKVMTLLLNAAPELMKIENHRSKLLPFHIACEYSHINVVKMFLDVCPLSVNTDNEQLVNFASRNSSTEVFKCIFDSLLTKSLLSDESIRCLLYSVITRKRVDLVRLIIAARPAILLLPGCGGRLPVHVACQHYDPEVLRLLCISQPSSLYIRCARGDLPIHIFLQCFHLVFYHPSPQQAVDGIRSLLKYYPLSLLTADSKCRRWQDYIHGVSADSVTDIWRYSARLAPLMDRAAFMQRNYLARRYALLLATVQTSVNYEFNIFRKLYIKDLDALQLVISYL